MSLMSSTLASSSLRDLVTLEAVSNAFGRFVELAYEWHTNRYLSGMNLMIG